MNLSKITTVLDTPKIPSVVDVLAIDLGNGYMKDTDDGVTVNIEPSVYSLPKDGVGLRNDGQENKRVSLGTHGKEYFIGADAVESKRPLESALGESDIERYQSEEYLVLLFGTIAKKYQQDVKIKRLSLGLPNAHFAPMHKKLIETVEGRQLVQVYGKEILIEIEQVEVLPQASAVYLYLFAQETIEEDANVNSFKVISQAGRSIGLQTAFQDIQRVLENKYEGYEGSVLEIERYMREGFRWGGKRNINIKEFPKVKEILDDNFNTFYKWVISQHRNLNKFDYVVWAGGMAGQHRDRIDAKEQDNFLVLGEPQTAIVKGLYYNGEDSLGE
jgi:hypothetical protein